MRKGGRGVGVCVCGGGGVQVTMLLSLSMIRGCDQVWMNSVCEVAVCVCVYALHGILFPGGGGGGTRDLESMSVALFPL